MKASGTKIGVAAASGGKRDCGGPNKFCPSGNTQNPRLVNPGYYGALPAVTGNDQTYQSQYKCDEGYTCDGGLKTLTIPGRYSKPGFKASDVIDCQPGYFCDYGSITSTGVTIHTQRLVLTGYWQHSSTKGKFSHDDWPRGVEIKGGKTITITGFTDGRLNTQFTILKSPKPTRNTFYVDFSTTSRAPNQIHCGSCKGIHNAYQPACMHYGPDGKTATNEWVESPMGMRCGDTGGTPRYGFGHENPEACKVTCNSVIECIGFTWHQGVHTQHSKIWNGGCEYVCNAMTSEFGICSNRLTSTSGYGKPGTRTSSFKCASNAVSGSNQQCYSKPCFRDSVAAKDCSWYCLSGGGGKTRHVSPSKTGCSHYKTKQLCEGSAALTNPECTWVTSPSNMGSATVGHRCTDLHDKPFRIIDALSYTGDLAPYTMCTTRQKKLPCPSDRLCSGGSIGDRIEFTTTKVRITEIVITGGGKTATIQRELLRGSQKPVYVASDKIDIVGFGNDIDGRWYIKETPATGYTSQVLLSRKIVISNPTKSNPANAAILCPANGPGCEMHLVNDRGRVPMCTDGLLNTATSHRYLRESEQAISSYESGIVMNVRDYRCNNKDQCDWDTGTNPPGYPAGKNGVILPASHITIVNQKCSPGYGEDHKDYNGGNPLFQVYDNLATTTDPERQKNWIGTADFTLATLHGFFTPSNPPPSKNVKRGKHTFCTKWDLDISVLGFGKDQTQTQECTVAIEIINTNDPPAFKASQLATRIFPEKAQPGFVIDIKDNNGVYGISIGGLSSLDSDAPGGRGQNNFFYLRQVNYPALPGCTVGGCKGTLMNANSAACQKTGCGCIWNPTSPVGAQCDWSGVYDWSHSFAVSMGDGSIIVNQIVARTYHQEVWLCVDVCDDANFFPPDVGGDLATTSLCTPSVPTNAFECPAAYADSATGSVGGQLIKLNVQDKNDAPYFLNTPICTASQPCKVRENAKTGDAVYWPGKLACELDINGARPSSCSKDGDAPVADFYGNFACDNADIEGNCDVADIDFLGKSKCNFV